jgi:bleomycin hydrolase
MRKEARAALAVVLIAALAAISASCRRESLSKGERVAEGKGRDTAVYMTRTVDGREQTYLGVDLSKLEKPSGIGEFTRHFHLPPVRQGNTGTCWAFAATSLLESELRRQGKPEVKLSEMFTVYWEYVEKARRYVREKGDSALGEGSEPNSALKRIEQYGLVRFSDYSGLPAGASGYDHARLFGEYKDYLEGLRARQDWDEARAIEGVRAILDRHLGRPPESISVDGRPMTPREYLDKVLGLVPADYVAFVSFLYAPFYAKTEFRVPDNWWHSADYLNLPLYEFDLALLKALRRGFTAALAVDFSEPGYSGESDVAVVPTFDIPRNFIDQSSREYRFSVKATTDDHSVHCVGYKEDSKETWFLIKDSWENAYWGKVKGYFFYRGDYIRLKCLMAVVHKDAVKEIVAKF